MIWIICFTAITFGVSLTYSWYKNRGSDIYISFKDVSGLIPNQSKIMYLGVEIGKVLELRLDENTATPIAKARITRRSSKMIGKKSEFWIVRPELALGSVRNLGAIATGDYIAVNPIKGEFSKTFIGLDADPVDEQFEDGLRIIIKSPTAAGIEVGSALLYRDVQIGEVGHMDISKDRRHVLIKVYIDDEYNNVIRKNSYFANISGFHASIHLFGGSEISLNSIRTLIKGGITVVTPNMNSAQAKNGDTFTMLTQEQFQELQDSNN
jgi:paraquat-inducible protein B